MARWVSVARASDCPDGEGRELVADGQVIALFHVAGEFHALDGSCPHQAGSLGRGKLAGEVVTCPRHGLCVNVKTGDYEISTPAKQPRYAVKIEDDQVFVDLDSLA
ncbi:MAG: Rieske 2Fe-2S domain-containing protein [Pirellulaceae bacterium]|nr:Rieske 2Fe-2S domain-containing protein [Planctomycetales bacterium]MCA9162406.1 Rieske 2Fe-2S domain-containing protein [Planctomycetales bacterium]MCA9205017.1 Rieske 2Fe-2S domain-containing protein [Planctomycetales bacterium]MCA9207433.1 Rieske 2Fe-2S domain-containing protein [Planctomycetales bacterium]MCA9220544.1 Rieske 2Fe-2S domain-containing protein [Planctomycetales bacterium]